MLMIRVAVVLLCAGLMIPLAQAGPGCTCRANGQKYEMGQLLCIRGKLSRCTMNLNNPSWKTIADICPEARLPLSILKLLTAVPAHDARAIRQCG